MYTGKGGVGKTSIAAATAVRAAELGHRTLVLSTDLAHSLADSLDLPLGPEPTKVAPRLWAQEPDVHHNMQTHWGTIQEWLKAALAWRGGVDGLVAEEVSIIPPRSGSKLRACCQTVVKTSWTTSSAVERPSWRLTSSPLAVEVRSNPAMSSSSPRPEAMALAPCTCGCRSPRPDCCRTQLPGRVYRRV